MEATKGFARFLEPWHNASEKSGADPRICSSWRKSCSTIHRDTSTGALQRKYSGSHSQVTRVSENKFVDRAADQGQQNLAGNDKS